MNPCAPKTPANNSFPTSAALESRSCGDTNPALSTLLCFCLLLAGLLCQGCAVLDSPGARQRSLDEWRVLTAIDAQAPRVFVKGDEVRFFFDTGQESVVFRGEWDRGKVPATDYRIKTALLLRHEKPRYEIPELHRGWREAEVVAGSEWMALATNLVMHLTPRAANHAASYQAFLADSVFYRDSSGAPQFMSSAQLPPGAILDRQFTMQETLEILASFLDEEFERTHPDSQLLLLMAPSERRFSQPVLVDRKLKRCVLLTPAALYDFREQGVTPMAAAQSLFAIVPEGHGVALLKNPVSSTARLADLGIVTSIRFLRFPLPKPAKKVPPTETRAGMDLQKWESWLDRYTGTRLQQGSLALRINGEGFFPGFEQALRDATNRIQINMYVFDRDDVGVEVANELKKRSEEVDTKVMFDRLGTIGAGQVPPLSPLPPGFSPPRSMRAYLQEAPALQVRSYLNPWFSSSHEKVLLVDGARGWLGGMNFGREYRYEWHDLMIEVRGPVLSSLESEFRRSWAHAGPAGDLAYLAALFQKPPAAETNTPATPWMKVRLLPTRTLWKPFSTAILNSLRQAQSHVFIENPYLLDKRVILALVHARNRGVDVRVILPRVNDFKAAGRASLVVANYLIEHGVRVYFYPGMTHAKAVMVDGWVCLGSGNLNHLSLRVNQEQNVATSDPHFAAEVRRQLFERDFNRSHELTEPIAVDWMDALANLLLEGF